MSAPIDLLAVPAMFWNDHADRMPTDDGAPIAEVVERRARTVLIRANDPGLRWLRLDAKYYADAQNMDECPRALRESAKRTLDALDKAGAA